MRLKKERIQSLSKVLAIHLMESGSIRFGKAKETLARAIEQIITNELLVEDRLEAEARKLLESYETQIEKGDVDPHRMLQMIKKQLAKEKGIVL